MPKLTPRQISKLIKEEDEDKEGDIRVVRHATKLLVISVKKLINYLGDDSVENITNARLQLAEVAGEVNKISEHINALAKKHNLVDLKVP
jgi:hypothetical protein